MTSSTSTGASQTLNYQNVAVQCSLPDENSPCFIQQIETDCRLIKTLDMARKIFIGIGIASSCALSFPLLTMKFSGTLMAIGVVIVIAHIWSFYFGVRWLTTEKNKTELLMTNRAKDTQNFFKLLVLSEQGKLTKLKREIFEKYGKYCQSLSFIQWKVLTTTTCEDFLDQVYLKINCMALRHKITKMKEELTPHMKQLVELNANTEQMITKLSKFEEMWKTPTQEKEVKPFIEEEFTKILSQYVKGMCLKFPTIEAPAFLSLRDRLEMIRLCPNIKRDQVEISFLDQELDKLLFSREIG